MACNIREILAEVGAQPNIGAYHIWLAMYGVLCRILQQFEPMAACDIKLALQEVGCCDNSSQYQLLLAIFGKLCQVLTAIETGGIQTLSCITCSDVDPVAEPACSCAFHMNRALSTLWYWDSNDSTWYKFG